MSNFWMPFYIGDYLADTMDFSAEENGAYIFLICHYWMSPPKSIRNDVNRLQDLARIKPSRNSAETMSRVLSKFQVIDGFLFHKRIEEERCKVIENKDKKSHQTSAARTARKIKINGKTSNVTDIETTIEKTIETDSVTESSLPLPLPLVSKKEIYIYKEEENEGGKKKREKQNKSDLFPVDEPILDDNGFAIPSRRRIPPADVIEMWNVVLEKKVMLTDSRQSKIAARFKDFLPTEIDWYEYFQRIDEGNDFIKGKTPGWGGATIDWALEPKNITKVLEGNYDRIYQNQAEKR